MMYEQELERVADRLVDLRRKSRISSEEFFKRVNEMMRGAHVPRCKEEPKDMSNETAVPETEQVSRNQIMRWFAFDHMKPGAGRDVSETLSAVATTFDAAIPDGPEKSAGLRKLLEAKDCLVRAALP